MQRQFFPQLRSLLTTLRDQTGTRFLNTCWDLGEPDTLQREVRAMTLGRMRWPKARGQLLYHEYALGLEQSLPDAEPAWKFLIGD